MDELDLPQLLDRPHRRLRDVPDEVHRALTTLLRTFDGLAVVRGGRPQIVLHRDVGRVHLLIADTANAEDHATMRAGIRASDERLATASELLGLALGIPLAPLRQLGPRLARIAELGAGLA